MTDHDAIAAKVRQDRETGTPGPWRIHDCQSYGDRCMTFFQEIWNEETNIIVTTEVTRARNDGGSANMRRIAALPDLEAAYLDLHDEVRRLRAERDDLAHMLDLSKKTTEAVLERAQKAEAERDALRAALDDARVACRIVDAAARAGHEKIGDLVLHMLSAVEPARAALKGDSDE